MFPRNTRRFSSSIEQYQKTNLLSRKRIVARFVFKRIIERESEKIVAIEKNSDDGEHEREKRMVGGGGGRERERENNRGRGMKWRVEKEREKKEPRCLSEQNKLVKPLNDP